MARLSKIFDQLAYGSNFSLRIVNNLEKGAEEIVIQKPDVVFVQTHLSGLSPEILLKHLKKQLGRKRSRFVLLATPGQLGKDTLKAYQGWLDISCKESELLTAIQTLLTSLLSKNKTADAGTPLEEITVTAPVSTEPATVAKTGALTKFDFAAIPVAPDLSAMPPEPAAPKEASLEDQGITYSPRSRLSVYSEFNSSFDNAVNKTPEPEPLVSAAPEPEFKWNGELIDTVDTVSPRSKRSTFLLWLAPVIVAVVVVTLLQKNRTVSKSVTVAAPPKVQPAEPSKLPIPAKPELDSKLAEKDLIKAIAENRPPKAAAPPSSASSRPSELPEFIPRYGFDKHYGTTNPGWERYKGQVTEFRVLREAEAIKAIQVIDRGGQGVPESFMKGVLRQVAKNPVFTVETSEKKEGYEIQRGRISGNIKVVFYRDEQGGKLRAFVIGWQ